MASRLLLLAAMDFLFVAAAAQHDYDTAFASCSTTDNYTDGSQYKKNLVQLLAALPAASGGNGWFYKGSAGSGADEVFGLIMCFADSHAAECLDCLSRAPAGITAACPGSRHVKAAYDACVLRYSAAPIPATADLDYAPPVIPLEPNTSDAVHAAWLPLMSKLAGSVATSPLRISNDSTPYKGPGMGPQEMYGLAQCTRDLNASECVSCISNYTDNLGKLFPNNTFGAIKGYSCYLRYQVGAFDVTLPPEPVQPPPSPQAAPGSLLPTGPSSSPSKTLIISIGMSVGVVSFFIILGLATCLLLRRRRRKDELLKEASEQEREPEEVTYFGDGQEIVEDEEFERGTGPKRFHYGELAIATDNFSDSQKLGEGGFGSVYRGFLKEMHLHVAIKRVSKGSKQGWKEYASEVRIISRLRHRNLVQLIGWCHGGGEMLLIYELMPNGSLDKHLHGSGSDELLRWPFRHEIVMGLGSALLYLHEEWEQCVVHRDIKPSNVMLDASFHAKLGDFGLARLVDHGGAGGSQSHTTVLAGTMGYMDPECMVTGRFSQESDIYSFGVLLLEVACGQRPVVVLQEHDDAVVHLSRWVSQLHERGMVLHAADLRLNGEFDPRQMECVLLVGLWCTQQDRSLRPSIRQVVSVLRFEAPLPSLSERQTMPEAMYVPPVPSGRLSSVPSSPVDDTTRTGTIYLSTSAPPLVNTLGYQ